MEIIKSSMAGTVESSDILIMLEPKEESGIEIQLKSSVEKQFGKQIRKVICDTLEKLEVQNVKITATDKGALDCTIRARVQSAVFRAAGIKENFDWEVID
ncbi:citrate lyase acyl carrier protein [Clostridium sp. UBA4548]|uniref:citrate lyase acyl carrier protein n=1 Tax=Clostridium sp. UBA4548 TaxID=1946361 RepID=UPI0025BC735E|nr:citrate lyase acyl carrier protein [Clostridium sp. UBA4548]